MSNKSQVCRSRVKPVEVDPYLVEIDAEAPHPCVRKKRANVRTGEGQHRREKRVGETNGPKSGKGAEASD